MQTHSGWSAARTVAAPPASHDRREWLAGRLAHADADLRTLARRDVEIKPIFQAATAPASGPDRTGDHRPAARRFRAVSPALGPATLALSDRQADPIVDAARPRAGPPCVMQWETLILKTAWDRLNLEGRLALAWPESYSPKPVRWDTIAGRRGAKAIAGNVSLSTGSEPTMPVHLESRERPAVSRGTSLIERDSRAGATGPPRRPETPVRWAGSRVCRTARSAWNNAWIAGARTAAFPLASTGSEQNLGIPIAIDRPEILWRASGLGRAGLVAQMTAPRLATRLAMGIEIPLAHTIVDRLLGFDRSFGREPAPAHARGMGRVDVPVPARARFVRRGRGAGSSDERRSSPVRWALGS